MKTERHKIRVEDYEQFIGAEEQRPSGGFWGRPRRDAHAVHVNSTYYGGGVAAILLSLTLPMNDVGVRARRGVKDKVLAFLKVGAVLSAPQE
jgi:hypothetical protein